MNRPEQTPPLPNSANPSDARLVTTRGGAVCCPHYGPAYTHVAPRAMPLPVLIAVPHAGRVYPEATLAKMRDRELCQLRLEDRHVDQLGLEIARLTGSGLLVAHAPRALIDLNRAHDDIDWEMIEGAKRRKPVPSVGISGLNRRARSGLGLVPRRLPGFGEIWHGKFAREELDLRIDRIHRPYHEFLASELERIGKEWGTALLIDLHSMPPLRQQNDQQHAPMIVVGDRFGVSCHQRIVARAFGFLEGAGCPAALNRPYSGGYVLDRHASPSRGLHAIQIEVCRSAYLDDRLAEPVTALKPLAQMLAGLVRELGAEVAQLGNENGLAQAAE